jgi:hypothetical protein
MTKEIDRKGWLGLVVFVGLCLLAAITGVTAAIVTAF